MLLLVRVILATILDCNENVGRFEATLQLAGELTRVALGLLPRIGPPCSVLTVAGPLGPRKVR